MQIIPIYNFAATITKDNSVNIPTGVTHAVYVGTAGTMVAVQQNGVTATFVGIAAGSILPIAIKRVNSTSTTSDNMVALYSV